jgi:UDP-N-acetylglucosamine 2-epimerase (non-hydrolysing)
VTEQSGIDNLKREGIDSDKVHFVGNVMIDTLMANRAKAEKSDVLKRLSLLRKSYGVITLHRPSNVDDVSRFSQIVGAFEEITKEMKLVFPIHPRTRNNLKQTDLGKRVEAMENLLLLDPLGYLDFLCLTSNAALVMTDSGGIQEETTILGVPCMTLRENTERPVTITEGTNRLVQLTTKDIVKNYRDIKKESAKTESRTPKLWDGKAAERIAAIIAQQAATAAF